MFRYHKKTCCCSKLINLYFAMTSSHLLFYYDKEYRRLFLTIAREAVIAINKRQLDRRDVFKFSIFYNSNCLRDSSVSSSTSTAPNNIKELKLKASTRRETEYWVDTLRESLKPKRYQFQYDKDLYVEANTLFPAVDSKSFYIKLCHLEYILIKDKFLKFFEYYHAAKNKDKCNESDDTIINDNQISVEIASK